MHIDVAAPDHGCTTRDLTSSWTVNGGVSPYAWTLVQAPSGFVLTAVDNSATVKGVPTAPGAQRITVRVRDAEGTTRDREWVVSVAATPAVTTRPLPNVCPHETYSALFTAEGGGADSFTWSVDPDFVAQTGLNFAGNRLSGSFIGAAPETFELAVTASNGDCSADPVEFSLASLEAGHPDCPDLVASSRSGLLPMPCAGEPYEAELIIEGGSGDYAVDTIEISEELTFDEWTQTLRGVVTTPGAVTLRVADGNGHTILRTFDIEPRTACWLAYLSDETGVSRLHLFDPELERRHVVPDDDSGGPVLDFTFSPNGRMLAFSSSVGADATRVQLLGMSSLGVAPLAFESATDYAWSEDASTLAVAYDMPDGRYLGGARISAAPPGIDPSIVALTPIEAEVDGELVWFADSSVAYLSNTIADLSWVNTTARLASGFDAPHTRSDDYHERASRLRPAANGVFLFPPSDFHLVYYGAGGGSPVPHAQIPRAVRAIAPSGRYLARVTEPNLELFPADKASLDDAPPEDSAAGCDAILTWARGRERIACATSEDGGRVSIFDVNTAINGLEDGKLVLGPYSLAKGSHTQRWRAFSKTGARLAFTSDDWVYVATLDDGTPRVDLSGALNVVAPEDDSVYSELAFSLDERFLAVHRGEYLRVFGLTSGPFTEAIVTAEMRTSERCEDDFTARSSPYCGADLTAAPYAWSGDSRWLVYQEHTGTLMVMDLRRHEKRIVDRILVGEPCTATCLGGSAFAYQPH